VDRHPLTTGGSPVLPPLLKARRGMGLEWEPCGEQECGGDGNRGMRAPPRMEGDGGVGSKKSGDWRQARFYFLWIDGDVRR